jgi:pyruvate/2-oxoacid:ferredoxin oxidoreductase beta subunit
MTMDRYSIYAPLTLGKREFCIPNPNEACPGCGAALELRHIYKALGLPQELKAKWRFPEKSKNGRGALLSLKKGRGGDESPIEILIDNEADLALTSLSLKPEPATKVAEGYAYVATACSSYPFDLIDKLKRAQKAKGPAFIHILTPCPVGWGFSPDLTVKIGFWAVESRLFPLYDVAKGAYRITVNTLSPRPIAHYIKAQERFKGLSESEIEKLSNSVKEAYRHLAELSQSSEAEVNL